MLINTVYSSFRSQVSHFQIDYPVNIMNLQYDLLSNVVDELLSFRFMHISCHSNKKYNFFIFSKVTHKINDT
jgi:hypothetical protein